MAMISNTASELTPPEMLGTTNDFAACPHCGKRLGGGCPHCGRSLQPGWNFCPFCAKSTEIRRATKRLRDRDSRDSLRELPPANVAEFKK